MDTSQLSNTATYEMASQACMRAMSNDPSLIALYGNEKDLNDSVVVMPALESFADKHLLARHRGLLDSYVFMKQFHDPDLHNNYSPTDTVSERLFNLLERERFESLGGERFAGVRQNLAALWAGSYTQETIDRHGGVEQLELVISFLCRECLNTAPAPDYITQTMASLRGPVEALIGSHLKEMALNRYDQQRYAQEVLKLLDSLGLNSERAQPHSDAVEQGDESGMGPDTEQNQPADDTDSHDHQQNDEGEERASADASDEQQAAVVRNADHEQAVEADLSDVEQLPEHDSSQESVQHLSADAAPPYRVFDPAMDEEVSALDLVDAAELKSLKLSLDTSLEQHAHLIRRLAARLQRLLMARQQRGWLDEQEEGILDTRRLSRLITDQTLPASYRIEADAPVRSTAVTILVDNSRSMLGRPIELAAVCAELLTCTLERCGVSSEVLGYTTVSMYGGASKAHWQAEGEMDNPGRLNSIRHIVYKSAQTPWRRARERFAVMLKTDLLKQNIDGEALQWAHRRLLKRSEGKRLLIVISDGAPSDAATLGANDKDLLLRHLQSVVNDIETRSTVHLMAIGIGHDVSKHYANAMTIKHADELGSALMEQLTRLLIDSDSRLVA